MRTDASNDAISRAHRRAINAMVQELGLDPSQIRTITLDHHVSAGGELSINFSNGDRISFSEDENLRVVDLSSSKGTERMESVNGGDWENSYSHRGPLNEVLPAAFEHIAAIIERAGVSA